MVANAYLEAVGHDDENVECEPRNLGIDPSLAIQLWDLVQGA